MRCPVHCPLNVHRDVGADYWTARTAVPLIEIELVLGLDSGPSRRTEVTRLLDEASHLAEAGGYADVSPRVAELSLQGA
jgi:hypothetical protein